LLPADPSTPVFQILVDAQDRAVCDLSLQPNPNVAEYVNVHAVGRFQIEHGWFTAMSLDEIRVAGFDLAPYVVGQDLTMNANQSLAQQRAENDDLSKM
jgi:hypothetical protein